MGIERPYYFFRYLVGPEADEFSKIMARAGRSWHHFKIDSFLRAPDTVEESANTMGLDLRETMCTLSKRVPAVTYHRPYGLILDGTARAYYDNDTGKRLTEGGVYNDYLFEFTHEVSLDYLLGDWYKRFEKAQRFTWNEVILEKGAKIVGAFVDPEVDPNHLYHSPYYEREFQLFMEKVTRLGLEVVHVTDKWRR